ncbi:Von Willebrand Factor D And Egf Domain-Containing Protein [Manis pentadactyla]|nr:Von Willebrand Factor D And Egf Domain-Containing Protein [Manis pentadactyla]
MSRVGRRLENRPIGKRNMALLPRRLESVIERAVQSVVSLLGARPSDTEGAERGPIQPGLVCRCVAGRLCPATCKSGMASGD